MRMIATSFPVTEPDSVRDYTVDFTGQAANSGAAIISVEWTLTIRSTVPGYSPDPDVLSRLIGDPTITGLTSLQRIGNLQPGNDYVFSAKGTFDNGEVITLWGILRCRAPGAAIVKSPNQQVAFDYITWIETFPEFSSIDELTATAYFNEATGLHANDGTGPVVDDAQQLYLLNLLTAHLAARYANGASLNNPMVGGIVSASEGSVSVSSQAITAQGTQAWYLTTRYGSDYWAATAPYRTMRYRVAAPRVFDPLWARYRSGVYW